MSKINKIKFLEILKKRRLENVTQIKIFESLLKKARGYVFKMPKKRTHVVLLVSGGLDSVVIWGILLKKYQLIVHPISFDLGDKRRKNEFKALQFFDQFYKKQFPEQYRKTTVLKIPSKNISIDIDSFTKELTEEAILSRIEDNSFKFNNSLGIATILPFFARSYAMYLNATKNLQINTIFCGVNAEDGEHVQHQTLTTLRSIMVNMCVGIKDYSWQFSSICLEPEIGLLIRKAELIKWAYKNNIPLEKTWSCYFSGKKQCGGGVKCAACRSRRDAFLESKIDDKTAYQTKEDYKKKVLDKIIRKISLIWNDS